MSRKRRKATGKSEEQKQNFTKLINHRVFAPTEIGNLRKISDSAIRILSEIGMSDAPKELCDLILEHGGTLEGNRLLYPANLIESTIDRHQKIVLLAGQTADNDLQVGEIMFMQEQAELLQIYKTTKQNSMSHPN